MERLPTTETIVYSGGMDSFTLLHNRLHLRARATGDYTARRTIHAISFDYGQRHATELSYAVAECKRLGIAHEVVDLRSVARLLQGSALTTPSIAVPEGHYAAESMRKTVVPGRNTLMLSVALAWTESRAMSMQATSGADYHAVVYGAHAGDHHIYPDCRAEYIDSLRQTMERATDNVVTLLAPFTNMDKAGILRAGMAAGLSEDDYARSWTCYNGGTQACGKCGSCDERREAFQLVVWQDPALAHERA